MSINADLLVNPDGVVRRVHVHVVGTAAGQPVEVMLVITTQEICTADVEQPLWLEDAQTKSNTTAQY
jgi:hypothetical protein